MSRHRHRPGVQKHRFLYSNYGNDDENLYEEYQQYRDIFVNKFLPNREEIERYLEEKDGLDQDMGSLRSVDPFLLGHYHTSHNDAAFLFNQLNIFHNYHIPWDVLPARKDALENAVDQIGGYIVHTKPDFLGALLYIEVESERQPKDKILLCLKPKENDTSRIELAVFAVLLRYPNSSQFRWLNHPSSTTKISEHQFDIYNGTFDESIIFLLESDPEQTKYSVQDLNYWSYSDVLVHGTPIEMKDKHPNRIKKTLDDLLPNKKPLNQIKKESDSLLPRSSMKISNKKSNRKADDSDSD